VKKKVKKSKSSSTSTSVSESSSTNAKRKLETPQTSTTSTTTTTTSQADKIVKKAKANHEIAKEKPSVSKPGQPIVPVPAHADPSVYASIFTSSVKGSKQETFLCRNVARG